MKALTRTREKSVGGETRRDEPTREARSIDSKNNIINSDETKYVAQYPLPSFLNGNQAHLVLVIALVIAVLFVLRRLLRDGVKSGAPQEASAVVSYQNKVQEKRERNYFRYCTYNRTCSWTCHENEWVFGRVGVWVYTDMPAEPCQAMKEREK